MTNSNKLANALRKAQSLLRKTKESIRDSLNEEERQVATEIMASIREALAEHDAQPAPAPAADGAEELLRMVATNIRSNLDSLPSIASDWVYKIDAAIAALRQPVPDAVQTFTTGHCKNNAQPGGCQLHNLQCGYPDCDRRPIASQQESRNAD